MQLASQASAAAAQAVYIDQLKSTLRALAQLRHQRRDHRTR